MSFQLIIAATLAAGAALWFLRGILQDFLAKEDCASGCGTCAKGCPFQAPVQPGPENR
jgi:Fe-S-cluster-containing dehydrogenase component